MRPTTEFFEGLRQIGVSSETKALSKTEIYEAQIKFLVKVTHSKRMAMLWLFVELGISPPEDLKLSQEELMFLWRLMPEKESGSTDSEKKLQGARITIIRRWFDSGRSSAPVLQEGLVPGMSRTTLMLVFKELLKKYLKDQEQAKIGLK